MNDGHSRYRKFAELRECMEQRRERWYWEWVDHQCALIKSDGCSKAFGVYKRRCQAHDLAYFYGRDPVDAYQRFNAGDGDYWQNANPITQAQADADMRRGIQADSRFGFYSPVAAWRWVVLKALGHRAWNAHRQHDAKAQT